MIIFRSLSIALLASFLATPAVGANAQETSQKSQPLLNADGITITEQDVRQELLVLSEAERKQMLANAAALKEFSRQLYLGKRLVAEAERLGLEQRPEVQAKLATQRRWILSDALRTHFEQQLKLPDFATLAREDYAINTAKYQLPEQFKVAHILKKTQCNCERNEQRQKIGQLLSRLQAGEDFATLAKAESDDTSKAQGGDLGWIKPEKMVAPFAAAMAQLKTGQLSDVVETEYGYHIIKLLDRQPARQQPFEEVKQAIEEKLRAGYVKTQLYDQGLVYLPGPDAKYNESAIETLLSTNQAKP